LLSAIGIWFLQNFGFADGRFGMVDDLSDGLLAVIGNAIAWLYTPLGWGNWQAAVATITGLIAKENVVGTFGVLYGFAEVAEDGAEIWGTLAASFTTLSAYSFLVFNLLCAPCFAAIGAIKREMNNAKWTWFAIGYQTVFAYAVSLCVFQIGSWFTGGGFGLGTVAAILLLGVFVYLLLKPHNENKTLNSAVSGKIGG
ncbi:MAG: nucleoside recognition domain-containing protein, partial [Eubacteriales bacterium]|nr:nucleoside recognition domain-containing protein [Eubacteriales bacterium]